LTCKKKELASDQQRLAAGELKLREPTLSSSPALAVIRLLKQSRLVSEDDGARGSLQSSQERNESDLARRSSKRREKPSAVEYWKVERSAVKCRCARLLLLLRAHPASSCLEEREGERSELELEK